MVAKDSRLVVQQDGQIIRVEFIDRNILEEASIQQIGDELSQIIEQTPNPKILINFANVEHLSSAALGTLITVNTKVRAKSGQLRLSNIAPGIYDVFVITKLNKLFQIHEDVAAATKSFK